LIVQKQKQSRLLMIKSNSVISGELQAGEVALPQAEKITITKNTVNAKSETQLVHLNAQHLHRCERLFFLKMMSKKYCSSKNRIVKISPRNQKKK
jgi:hypothetical protein